MAEADEVARTDQQGPVLQGHARNKALKATDYVPIGPNVLDLMIIYTPEARAAAGGTSAISDRCVMAVESFNQALEDSDVDLTVNMKYCGAIEESYVEDASFSIMLYQMRIDAITLSDGSTLDEKRDTLAADVVHLFVNNDEYCGIGSYNYDANTDGLSVGNFACSSTYHTLAHEVGHNMGLHHDRYTHYT